MTSGKIGSSLDRDFSLYFHIPFCQKKCSYCHFYVLPDREDLKDQLLTALEMEWSLRRPLMTDRRLVSLYFGGGTPSLFGPSRLSKIFSIIWSSGIEIANDCEITLEMNPEDVSDDSVRAYRDVGVNRMSMGVQSFLDSELVTLGRVHHKERSLGAIESIHRQGIDNLSIDLMMDLPQQTEETWLESLSFLPQLPISHLSLYNLTIEPHTGFGRRRAEIEAQMPDEESSQKLMELAFLEIEKAGLKRYEISAFSLPDKESRHNLGYWQGRSFLGLGPSAFSYWRGERFRNPCQQRRYAKDLASGTDPVDFRERLSVPEHIRELFVIGLRPLVGISLPEFQNRYGVFEPSFLQRISELTDLKLLEMEEHTIRLTHRGRMLYDTVASELI